MTENKEVVTQEKGINVTEERSWEEALEKLPEPLQKMARESGLDSCLDWQYWGTSSFFGLTFEDESAGKYFDEYEQEYTAFLGDIEEAMWNAVQNDDDFEAFKVAYDEN